MPIRRIGRQSSPSKGDEDSPSKTRVQPMRSARLRSASPFLDIASASTSAAASQPSSQTSSPSKASPSKAIRPSPRKVAPASSSLQLPVRRSTRSRSRSVDPESLPIIGEDVSPATSREVSEALDAEVEAASPEHDQENATPEPRLATISEDAAPPTLSEDVENAEMTSSNDSSDTDSNSDPDSDSDGSSNTDSDDSSSASSSEDEQEGDATADLDALLKASQQAYKSRAPAPAAQSRFEDNQDVISFDAGSDHAQRSQRTGKVMPLVVKAKHQVAKLQPSAGKQPRSSKDKFDQQIEALGEQAPTSGKKKSKHARTVQTSTGSSWFDMPEFGASASRLAALKKHSAADGGHAKATGGDARLASAEQLRREVQALRLRNALDPKRFYRASAKNQAMPKFAQLGRIIASPLEPKAVLSRQERGRTVVEELIRDAEAASYAKRKFSESQASHRSNYNGRRKPPSKKRRS
ncbi:hypothetical protein EX895_006140 [Sporisorium graminicola]|uniref:Fcf2 pre-rRNA processing C-terminal domain-containing protein n=1 Tax=Sporisorium graminicola TaxID=280036 RepID=A0A4U7KLH3_9BASI|nr:hypothetical protein EX895_006140 [Sporisorium graminicola]TKY85060.1 hypothetical protein EX895_006140 [Sporisorium graminicola]